MCLQEPTTGSYLSQVNPAYTLSVPVLSFTVGNPALCTKDEQDPQSVQRMSLTLKNAEICLNE
jgi:hypothetical protein